MSLDPPRLDPLRLLPPATPETIKAARLAAGLTQAQAAATAGLGDVMRWSEYERGLYSIDASRWAMFLLTTGQHPKLKLTKHRRSPTPSL